jgi:predicted transcriptional regulator YdeE
MEIQNIEEDLHLFGITVASFPTGVREAFGRLSETIRNGAQRSYYGYSYFDKNGKIVYKAAAREEFTGEGDSYGYENFSVPKGDYLAEHLDNWMDKTDCIKDVFEKLMSDPRVDTGKPVLEWYQSEKEMLCLVPIKK